MEAKKAENEKSKKETEKVQKQKKKLLEEYRKQEAELNEKMRSTQVDIASIQNNMININTSVAGKLNFSGNGALMMPVRGGSVSAGTWYYPGGGVHLGLDMACLLYTSHEFSDLFPHDPQSCSCWPQARETKSSVSALLPQQRHWTMSSPYDGPDCGAPS